MLAPNSIENVLPSAVWQARREAHLARLAPVLARLRGFFQAGAHPIYDFLKTYYSFALSNLENWSPGVGVRLLGPDAAEIFRSQRFWRQDPRTGSAWLDVAEFPATRRQGLVITMEVLAATAGRPASFGCFGLHEWAMVYRQNAEEVRHNRVPLRMAPGDLAEFVEGQRIRCSHWDAFRFFTAPARPLNALQPGPDNRAELEQPGCLHANMDLYKWAYKYHPFVPSEILADAFLLALEIRELDMRASPYDLRKYGFEPVRIETPAGRAEYETLQRAFARRAAPIRTALLEALRRLLEA